MTSPSQWGLRHPSLASAIKTGQDFDGYSFTTNGTGNDLDIEVTELPSERRERLSQLPPLRNSLTPPPFPFLDLSILPVHTSMRQGVSTMSPPPRPEQCFALQDLNTFPAIGRNGYTNEHLPIRADDFRVTANAGHATDAPEAGKGGKSVYSSNNLIGLTCTCVDINPWIAPHGKKAAAWEETLSVAAAQKGFRHPGMNATTLQHKCEVLVGFKKDPEGKYKNLAKVIGEGTSASITIGALLERMEIQYDEAKDKTDEAKVVLKKKNDEDREGGEAICQASLRTMRRKRSPTPTSDDDDDATDTDNDNTAPKLSPASSLATLDDDNGDKKKSEKKPVAKHCRLNKRRSASGKDALLAVMKEENERRAEHDDRVATSLDVFVKDACEQKAELNSLLRALIASDRN
ncbi:hypothetical protein C8R46DRAFT_1249156 [Mycena filopes]|nr:hypothetical protein C8R46DRAFT_1249156 [Mycena filopes]